MTERDVEADVRTAMPSRPAPADLFPPPFPNREMHIEPCPGCTHVLGAHAVELGCVHGWTWDGDGNSVTDGCECPLTLAGQHRPPNERDL